MKVNINGVPVEKFHVSPIVQSPLPERSKLEKAVTRTGRFLLPVSVGVGVLNIQKIAFAASTTGVPTMSGNSLSTGLMPLVKMVQDFSLPIGIVVSTWGLIEMMIGNPSGKLKLKNALIGYVGIFIIPTVFYAIKGAFAGWVG